MKNKKVEKGINAQKNSASEPNFVIRYSSKLVFACRM